MANAEHSLGMSCEVTIRVTENAPGDIFDRAKTTDFQTSYYGSKVSNEQTVLEHWSFNAVANGVRDVSLLDGWNDLSRGMVTMDVVSVERDW